jgi:uncharacterized NAD(P)/FAD-binding protein YdhS
LERSGEPASLELLAERLGHMLRGEHRGFSLARLVREARTADPLTRLREDIAEAESGGPAWRLALEAIGAHAPRIWRWLGPLQQERFLREEDGLWQRLYYVKRHAQQRGTAVWLRERMEEGRITVGSARDGNLPAYDRIVVATGPEYHALRNSNPLIRQMLRDGLAQSCAAPSGYELGGLWTRNLQLANSPGIWAMGSLVRGEEFAVHGYPSLERHARIIAAQWL